MNIGIVTTWFERGAGYVSKAFKKALEGENNVFIYARGGESYAIGDPNWDLDEVTWSPWFGKTNISLLHFAKWLEKFNIELIIFNEQQILKPVLFAKKKKYIVGAYIDYYTKNTIKKFDIYDFLICNTKRHYSVFKNHSNSVYIPWGTDPEIFKIGELEQLVRSDKVTFFHSAGMGGINLRKGTDLLVKAFQKVTKPARLIIHSQSSIDIYGKNISNIIQNDERIQFIHRTVKPPGLYHLGDVYVYPSKLEGIGLTICEAMSVGLVIVTTNCPPMNEFVNQDRNGMLINVAYQKKRSDDYYWPESYIDIDHLTKILNYYASNPQIVIIQKKKSRAIAENERNWKNSSDLLLKFISKLKLNSSLTIKLSKKEKTYLFFELFYLHLKTLIVLKKIDIKRLFFKF